MLNYKTYRVDKFYYFTCTINGKFCLFRLDRYDASAKIFEYIEGLDTWQHTTLTFSEMINTFNVFSHGH